MITLTADTTTFTNQSYKDVIIPAGAVVYCDPPYEGTTKYSNSGGFNHDEFWEYVRELSKDHMVFISEISAPPDFTAVWNKPFKRVLDVNKENIFDSVEKLFIHNCNLDKYIENIRNIVKRLKEANAEVIFLTQNFMNTKVSCHLKDEKLQNCAESMMKIQTEGILKKFQRSGALAAKEAGSPCSVKCPISPKPIQRNETAFSSLSSVAKVVTEVGSAQKCCQNT